MLFKNILHKILRSVLFLLLVACASRSVPTGGPKDEDPPLLIESFPENKAINFSGKEIILSFNEKIKIQNLEKELMLTPNLDIKFDYKARRNNVILNFDENFPDSTTITLNFREAIQDITEGNPAENLQLAFSTGPYIDSLSISGKIYHLLVNKPAEDVTVALYYANDTLDIFNSTPVYLTKSVKEGNFLFENLKSDVYKIYAFIDKNKNGTCETQKEPFGFLKSPIKLDSNVNQLRVPIQLLDSRDPELISAKQTGHYFILKYNKYIVDYKLETTSGDSITHTLSQDHSSMRIFNTFHIQDSLQTFVHVKDSVGQSNIDTVYVKFEETRREKDPFNIKINDAKYYLSKKLFEGTTTFTKPALEINTDSIKIQIDSSQYYHFDRNQDFAQDPEKMKITITVKDDSILYELFSKKNSQGQRFKPILIFNEASVISIEMDSSENVSKSIRLIDPMSFGIIKGRVNTDHPNFIIQLLDSKNNVVQSIINSTTFRFDYVEPAKYRIRLLVDKNNNGHWDPGNIHFNVEPEPVYFYKDPESGTEEIQIKSNWEISELVLIVNDSIPN